MEGERTGIAELLVMFSGMGLGDAISVLSTDRSFLGTIDGEHTVSHWALINDDKPNLRCVDPRIASAVMKPCLVYGWFSFFAVGKQTPRIVKVQDDTFFGDELCAKMGVTDQHMTMRACIAVIGDRYRSVGQALQSDCADDNQRQNYEGSTVFENF